MGEHLQQVAVGTSVPWEARLLMEAAVDGPTLSRGASHAQNPPHPVWVWFWLGQRPWKRYAEKRKETGNGTKVSET